MTVAPAPRFPEVGGRTDNVFERSAGSEARFQGGPLRFQEGVQSDRDIPNDFARGAYGDTAPYRGASAATNPEHVFKRADETMRERAHVGSASWIEAPQMLGDFVQGAIAGDSQPEFEYAYNSGLHQARPNKVRVG